MQKTTNFTETADIETASDDYARRFAGDVGDWFLQVQEEATLRMLAPYPHAAILDVGGGHGQTADALVQEGYRLTVHGSAPVCRQRIHRLVDAGLCDFKVGDILALPFPDNAFDVVLSYRLLSHVEKWQAFLAELARVARRAVIVDYPEVRSANYIAPQLFRFKKSLEGNTRTYTCFRESELVNILTTQGFVKAESYAEFFWPMVLHRTLKTPTISSLLERIPRTIGLTRAFGSPVIIKFVSQGDR
jgi:ubiquinone/menaquinone biosynthesis C-methylase UbiE